MTLAQRDPAATILRPEPTKNTPSAGEQAVVVSDLVVGFGSLPPVLQGVSLSVAKGERVALIGANGAGKSTLLRALLRLVEPRSGRIDVLGQDVMGLRGEALRRYRAGIGFVFQKHNLVPRLSALSNVVHGALGRRSGPAGQFGRIMAWHQGFAPASLRREAVEALARVQLVEKALSRAGTLSGGQSQRVAIARALMQRPRLMLADEPVASLDPRAGDEVMGLFVDLVQRDGLTLLFTSHQMEHVRAYAGRVIGLAAGRIVIDGPADSFSPTDLRMFFTAREDGP